MKLAVMDPTKRDGDVAHSAAHRTRLGKGEVMRIRRHAPAHEARLSQHESGYTRIIDHRLVKHRQQLLRNDECCRIESRTANLRLK
jgi:hypothetical protein